MNEFFKDPEQWQIRLVVTLAVILGVVIIRVLVLRLVRRRVEDTEVWYNTQKASSYAGTFIVVIVVALVWLQVSNIGAWIGVVSAGIAIALSDVLRNFAGWSYILLRRPFKIGDRVEIDGQTGDVVDFRAQRFSMLEIKGWVDADQATGRIIQIPNGLLFSKPLANYTQGFPFIWHEVPMLVTFESDWKRAEALMKEVLEEHAPSMASDEARQAIRDAATEYRIRFTHFTPTTYVAVRESGVIITGRLIIPVRSRRHVDTTVWRSLLEKIGSDPSVELAYPTVRTYLPDLTITNR